MITKDYIYFGTQAVFIIAFIITKLNDQKHMKKYICEIKKDIERLEKETKTQGERISKIEGRLNGE